MGVLLGLGDAELGHVVIGEELAEDVVVALLAESDQLVRNGLVVVREADVGRLDPRPAVKAVEIVAAEGAGDLAGTVRTEVEEDDAVVILYSGERLAVLHHGEGDDELIGLSVVVGSLNAARRGIRGLSVGLGQIVIGQLHALPAVVAVHRVVTAADRRDLADADLRHLLFQGRHIFLRRCRGRVAAVQEAVDKDLRQTVPLCKLQKGVKMVRMGMDAARGDQTPDMQRGIVLFAVFDRSQESRVLKEITVLDRLGDPGQVLIDDAAGAHVQMADLGVAHLAVRKTDKQAAGLTFHKGAGLEQLVQIRGLCFVDRVVSRVLAQAEAVHDA